MMMTADMLRSTIPLNVQDGRGNNACYGLAVGFTVLAAIAAGEEVSGGSVNPAVTTGLSLFSPSQPHIHDGPLWAYWAGPAFGAFFAALYFSFLRHAVRVSNL